MADIGQVATPNGNAKSAGLISPKQLPQLTITRVENGYILNPVWGTGEQKVAKLLDEMLELVKEYFADKV